MSIQTLKKKEEKVLMNKRKVDGGGDEAKVAKRKLKDWGYGEGVDGYKISSGMVSNVNVLIIDSCFPWWWSVALSLDCNVLRIWLTSCPLLDVEVLKSKWCTNTEIDCGSHPTTQFAELLDSCDMLLIGGGIPNGLNNYSLWRRPRLRVLVSTTRVTGYPKDDWTVASLTVTHSAIGGVTNGDYKVHTLTRRPLQLMGCGSDESVAIKQDLRWILKMGVAGSLSCAPVLGGDGPTATKVVYCDKGVIGCASLIPYNRFKTVLVRTPSYGNSWVTRRLSVEEQLRVMDVPERLWMIMPESETQQRLLDSVPVPCKVLHHVFQHVTKKFNSCTNLKFKRKRLECDIGPSATKRIRYIDEIEHNAGSIYPIVKLSKQCRGRSEDKTPLHTPIADPNIKATRRDDAEIRTELWDNLLHQSAASNISESSFKRALAFWRRRLLQIWRLRVFRSYVKWKGTKQLDNFTIHAARDCIRRVAQATWWMWNGGSRPFFWRWPVEYQSVILYGHPPWFSGQMKRWFKRQRHQDDVGRHSLIVSKLSTIRERNYVEPGNVHSVMPYFDVPKGEDDIRMVYDGSANGLNGVLWAPWFPLPTVDYLVRALEPGYGMADNDVGEMFHNFILHEDIRKYCGLDLTPYFKREEQGKKLILERWNRLAMGLRSSPYMAVQAMSIAQEMILGNRANDATNIFHWHKVELNLPGSETYDPSRSWFRKVRRDGKTAADIFVYVDDIRSSAPSNEEAWMAAQRTSSMLGYLGIQDAARKRRNPSQETGAWTGSVVWTTNNEVSILTTQEKWDKMKQQISWIEDHVNDPKGLESKPLLSIRGYLVYMSRTYPTIVPYLKGLHATIDSWRPGRDTEGWKIKPRVHTPETDNDCDELFVDPKFGLTTIPAGGPKFVKPVPRLRTDIFSLKALTKDVHPPRRRVRMDRHAQVVYGFGDASKQGFGASIELPDRRLYWRYGRWTLEDEHKRTNLTTMESKLGESSNYRELRNLVEALETAIMNQDIVNCDIFMFTDNSTAEAAYSKGTSSSRLLFELVLRLRKLEMQGTNRLHVIHVAGTRMICQGTDGLSRGDHLSGVMAGSRMIDFVPLHLSADKRSCTLVPWLLSWTKSGTVVQPSVQILCPDDWPVPIRDPGIYVWLPPPAVADVAAEFMAHSIHKRPNSVHIFACPRLMTSRWMRLLTKASDIIFRIPIGTPIWDVDQHEPLYLTIVFPLNRNHAGRFKTTNECEHKRLVVQEMLTSSFPNAGFALRQLIAQAWGVESL